MAVVHQRAAQKLFDEHERKRKADQSARKPTEPKAKKVTNAVRRTAQPRRTTAGTRPAEVGRWVGRRSRGGGAPGWREAGLVLGTALQHEAFGGGKRAAAAGSAFVEACKAGLVEHARYFLRCFHRECCKQYRPTGGCCAEVHGNPWPKAWEQGLGVAMTRQKPQLVQLFLQEFSGSGALLQVVAAVLTVPVAHNLPDEIFVLRRSRRLFCITPTAGDARDPEGPRAPGQHPRRGLARPTMADDVRRPHRRVPRGAGRRQRSARLHGELRCSLAQAKGGDLSEINGVRTRWSGCARRPCLHLCLRTPARPRLAPDARHRPRVAARAAACAAPGADFVGNHWEYRAAALAATQVQWEAPTSWGTTGSIERQRWMFLVTMKSGKENESGTKVKCAATSRGSDSKTNPLGPTWSPGGVRRRGSQAFEPVLAHELRPGDILRTRASEATPSRARAPRDAGRAHPADLVHEQGGRHADAGNTWRSRTRGQRPDHAPAPARLDGTSAKARSSGRRWDDPPLDAHKACALLDGEVGRRHAHRQTARSALL